MTVLVPYFGIDNIRVMIFVDGENLAIRFGALLKAGDVSKHADAVYRPDVYVWRSMLSGPGIVSAGGIIRSHYYTAVQGNHPTVEEVGADLKAAGLKHLACSRKPGARGQNVSTSHSRRKCFCMRPVSITTSRFW